MGIIDTAINWAQNHITAVNPNYQYVWAGRGPTGWDCSGFVSAAYIAAGTNVAWSTTETMLNNFSEDLGFTAIPYNSSMHLQKGDILMYTNATGISHGRACGHAAMYLGILPNSGNVEQQVDAIGRAYGIKIHDFNRNNIWEYVIRYTLDSPGTSAYGYMGETPSAWNSGNRRSNTATQQGDVSNVTWQQTGNDAWGNPIGYSYTSQANFTPYIATLTPYANKVDYQELINNRVSGIMMCAGWLFDAGHRIGQPPRKEYIAPHLKEQMIGCQSAGLPYALYAIIRAKSRIEADQECRNLYYVVSKFPPNLGLWLYMDMHNQIPINEEILDCYYKYIVDWGLGFRCGIYTDPSRLHQIDWNKYQNKFYLWMIDHADQNTLNTINDHVLTSDFFEVE